MAGAAEAAIHATGRYPDWWKGRRFPHPTRGWVASTTSETTRDNAQRLMLGEAEPFGTGMIPAEDIIDVTRARGIAGAVDFVKVRNQSGGVSHVKFKAYEQGWEKFQSDTIHWAWLDEEPPDERLYSETLTRMNATGGLIWITFTPLLGMTKISHWFYPEPTTKARALVQMTIDDTPHYLELSDEARKAMIDKYEPWEREARLKGIPMLGSGRVFPVADSQIAVKSFEIPDYWPELGGIDFGGGDHPTAAVRMAWDRDADCIYITACHKEHEATPALFASTLRHWDRNLTFAWPHDGWQQDRSSMKTMADLYRAEGIRMLHTHAQFQDGGNGLEAGIAEMLQRMKSGRWKVFDHLQPWFDEFHVYHREQGKIVKNRDDLLCASRYAMMMRRFSRAIRSERSMPRNVGISYDPLSPRREIKVDSYDPLSYGRTS